MGRAGFIGAQYLDEDQLDHTDEKSIRCNGWPSLRNGLCRLGTRGAPMVKTQAPGFYRIMIGEFEVTALNDGVIAYPTAQVLPKATPEQIKSGLEENGLTDPVEMSYNAFLINTGRKLVLIDTGTGGKLNYDPGFHGAGHLMANLRAAGYSTQANR